MSTLAARTFPLLPLKKTVILPGADAVLTVGRSCSLEAIAHALGGDRIMVASTQHDSAEDDPRPDGLHRTGTLVRLLNAEPRPDGTTQVAVVGLSRVSIHRIERTDRLYSALAEVIEEPEAASSVERLLQEHVVELYVRQCELRGRPAAEAREELSRYTSAAEVADYLGGALIADWKDRQRFLDMPHPADRLERLAVMMTGDAELADLEARIRTRVRQQIDKSQREYYLREQLRVIHDELSGEAGNEIQVLREKVQAAGLPAEVADRALREVNRLERMQASSPESSVIRTYVDWILSLPWNSASADSHDIGRTAEVLDDDHYGLDSVKDRIVEFLAVRELTARAGETPRSPILCLVGPPGVGKTSLGQSVARALGRSFVRISLGGVRDEAEIRGHRRTYVGALPGRLVQGLRQAGTSNPVMLLDEIDKMSADYKGDPSSAMLEVLDPEQNRNFVDHYLELPFDLSHVLFIATANSLDNIPRPLLDRMEVVRLSAYTEDEKVQIARKYLLPRQLRAHGIAPHYVDVSDKMLRKMIRHYTREAGVRNLERQLAAVCRKSARSIVAGRTARIRVTDHLLEEYLGAPRKLLDVRNRQDQVGIAMGMAWTEVGGTLLPVEVATLPGKGNVTVTGRLGDVMQESARAALSYARSRASELGIPVNFQETTDLHIHLPEGAVPKDGPSAGITMASALISALTKRPVRADVAMTGEITLRGRVLPIGGLKEKVLAAHQAGIRHVIAPRDNELDADTLPRSARRELQFHWVDNMDEVIAVALRAGESHAENPAPLLDDQPGNFDIPLHGTGA